MPRLRPDISNREQQVEILGFKKEQYQGSDCASEKPGISVKGGVRGDRRTSKAPKIEREKATQV